RKAPQHGAKAVPAENTDDRVSMAALGVVEPLLLEPEVLPQQPEDHAVAGACSTWRDGCAIPDPPLSLIERPQHGAREPVGAPIERVRLHELVQPASDAERIRSAGFAREERQRIVDPQIEVVLTKRPSQEC